MERPSDCLERRHVGAVPALLDSVDRLVRHADQASDRFLRVEPQDSDKLDPDAYIVWDRCRVRQFGRAREISST